MFRTAEEIQEIDLEGFQVISGELFRGLSKPHIPTLTIWNDSICFSKAAVTSLQNCERIRIEVDNGKKLILVSPVTTSDRNNVRWAKVGKDVSPRRIDCKAFTIPLYEQWAWKKDRVYRSVGRLVMADKKLMMLFDFNNNENWEYKTKTKGQSDA